MKIFWRCLEKWGRWVYRPEKMTGRWLEDRGNSQPNKTTWGGVAAFRGQSPTPTRLETSFRSLIFVYSEHMKK